MSREDRYSAPDLCRGSGSILAKASLSHGTQVALGLLSYIHCDPILRDLNCATIFPISIRLDDQATVNTWSCVSAEITGGVLPIWD